MPVGNATEFYGPRRDNEVRNGSVTVTVRTPLTASFTHNVTCCPTTLNLNSSASTGSILSYSWDLSRTVASPAMEVKRKQEEKGKE